LDDAVIAEPQTLLAENIINQKANENSDQAKTLKFLRKNLRLLNEAHQLSK